MPDGTSEYERLLLQARRNGTKLSNEAVQRILAAFNRAIRDIAVDESTGRITAERAATLARQVKATLKVLESEIVSATARGVALTVDMVVATHRQALTILEKENQIVGLLRSFDSVSADVVGVLAARERNAAVFETLIARHMQDAAPALDELLSSAISRGVSSAALTKDVARLLGGAEIEYADYGLERPALTGLRSVYDDARMIAVSETNNALREANARSMATGRVIEAVQWQLSGNHGDRFDDCDVLAQSDWFGFGPGWFDVRQWPGAPHPFCACYQGGVRLRPASEWRLDRDAAPEGVQDGLRMFTSEGWTARATQRYQANALRVVTLAVAHPVGGR